MYNWSPSTDTSERYSSSHSNMYPLNLNVPVSNITNKYVYVKQNLASSSHNQKTVVPKVLVNPNFNKKVFLNPNFNANNVLPPTTSIPKIHVNPNVQKLNLNTNNECTSFQKIHINPSVLRNTPVSLNNARNITEEIKINREPTKEVSHIIVSTRTKFIRSPLKTISSDKPRKRRSSVRSKFKIIKSSVLENPIDNKNKKNTRASVISRYKLVKTSYSKKNYPQNSRNNSRSLVNKFKLDNRGNKASISPLKNRKYVYINRFSSISDLARNGLLKQNLKIIKSGVLNISGNLYKKSPNCLRRTTTDSYKKNNVKRTQESTICKSKYKFIRKSMEKITRNENDLKLSNLSKVSRKSKEIKKKIISPGKLRKCNIPCPYYKKFGRCKGKDNGKCYRKHDPDQIALCTKFLQGACVDTKCLLSHNVSAEKMPTCKFYLEGSCSRDDCPYLHVRINPNADICRDFLEGFCKKAAECNKRHQFLCPDYEKNGSCLKQRCPYPHGKMVRKYSVFTKNKFAKKSSDCKIENKSNIKRKESGKLIGKNLPSSDNEANVKTRYYVERNILPEENYEEASNNDQIDSNNAANCNQKIGVKSRPKLGKLPSFIAFDEV